MTFYESYPSDKLTQEESQALGLHLKKKRNVHANRAICLLSRNPFFDCFKEFLNYLWRLSLSNQEHDIPIERFVYEHYVNLRKDSSKQFSYIIFPSFIQ